MVKVKRNILKSTERLDDLSTITYKDVATLSKYLRPRGGLSARYYNHVSAKAQRKITREIKRARHLGLLPFIIQA